MAKGVSGALTRLANVSVPPLAGPGRGRAGARARQHDEDEDLSLYIPDDLEELSARTFVRRRREAAAELPVAAAAAPAVSVLAVTEPAEPAAGRGGKACAGRGGRTAPPAPVAYADPVRTPARRVPRRLSEPDEAELMAEAEEEEEEMAAEPSGFGRRLGQRIRRIKTTLAARGSQGTRRTQEEEDEELVPVRRGAAPSASKTSIFHNDPDSELERDVRASWRPKQLARLRRRLGMTQAEFARCYGLDVVDVIRWEEGQRPGRAERILLTLIMHDPEEVARLVDEAMPLE